MAAQDEHAFQDSDCSVLRELFVACTREKVDRGFELSRAYASFAKRGLITVYLGSDKDSEPIGFHIGNNFWSAELPYLRQLLRQGVIDDVIFKLVSEEKVVRELSLQHDDLHLPLWRRQWHPHDGEERKDSFVWEDTDWENWRRAPPRPFITYSRLLEIVRHWKRYARRFSDGNSEGGNC